jgi:hypothetical protein
MSEWYYRWRIHQRQGELQVNEHTNGHLPCLNDILVTDVRTGRRSEIVSCQMYLVSVVGLTFLFVDSSPHKAYTKSGGI